MDTHLSDEIRAGIEHAQKRAMRKGNRLNVRMGTHSFHIIQAWEGGFTIEAIQETELRGLVDIYDGAKHLYQCLIVCCEQNGIERKYEYKRTQYINDHPVTDYVKEHNSPIALLK